MQNWIMIKSDQAKPQNPQTAFLLLYNQRILNHVHRQLFSTCFLIQIKETSKMWKDLLCSVIFSLSKVTFK